MKTATIRVEIPDGYEPIGEELRVIQPGELYWDNTFEGGGEVLESALGTCGTYLPIRRVQTVTDWWPSWLLVSWVAKDYAGDWYGFYEQPKQRDGVVWMAGDNCVPLTGIIDTSTFPSVPWQESCFRNPRSVK